MSGFKRAVFGALLALAIAACGRPDFNTDLTPEGPPEVRAVAVSAEGVRTLATDVDTNEFPTFCQDGVPEEKSLVHYCPEENVAAVPTVADTIPIGFYVRVAFDELLDPDIETIDDSDPDAPFGVLADGALELSCDGNAITTTGFYDPTGSHLTFPAGPALVVTATGTVATGWDCEVNVGAMVTDKDGEAVPTAQRGPYGFTIAPLSGIGEPADTSEGVEVNAAMLVQFNNFIDAATIDGEVTLHDDTADVDVPVTVSINAEDETQLLISATAGALDTSTDYTITVAGGTVADVEGGLLGDPVTFSFTTTDVGLPDAGAPDA